MQIALCNLKMGETRHPSEKCFAAELCLLSVSNKNTF